MSEPSALQILLYIVIILLLVKPLGWHMAQVYAGKPCFLHRILSPLERLCYRLCQINPDHEMNWKQYAISLLLFNMLGILVLYGLLRLQSHFFLNPQLFPAVPPNLAFNTAISFVTNTNWQAYGGESTLSYLSQSIGLTVQNFLSASTGMSVLVALIRGFSRRETTELGNFWVDLTRGVVYILLPLALLLAIILSSQGVIQNIKPYEPILLVQPIKQPEQIIKQQLLPMGPAASQVAIKQLGTNGGGFFNTNSAHPFENPTPLTNFLEMLAILLIPAALCYTFGILINNIRQGWTLLVSILVILVPLILFAALAEQQTFFKSNQLITHGNMEGKETRIGIVGSSTWTVMTTATANGSVNSMLDSYTPLGGLIPIWLMHLGEVIFGGVGAGLYGMLVLVIITVFLTGLMVGRTPEFLGKKIEPFEIKMATLIVLLIPLIVLIMTAVAIMTPAGIQATLNPGAHGLSEILYAFTSMGNNNGSSFSGINANTPFYTLSGGIVMLLTRYWIIIAALAIAGSLAQKKPIPTSTGTLPTDGIIFVLLLDFIIILIGALTFFPALSLGPIIEHLLLGSLHGN